VPGAAMTEPGRTATICVDEALTTISGALLSVTKGCVPKFTPLMVMTLDTRLGSALSTRDWPPCAWTTRPLAIANARARHTVARPRIVRLFQKLTSLMEPSLSNGRTA
jgi:hypothetical protein